MTSPSLSYFRFRRWHTYTEETLANEAGVPADGKPVRKIVLGAVIRNPYAGSNSIQALDEVVQHSAALGVEFGRRLNALLGDDRPESFGKACIVGTAGEYEHGNAFLTATFADPLREALGGGKAWIASTGKRGVPGTTIDIPLAHKDALYVRSHYDTVTVSFPDGPNPDEVLILFAVATRGRLHARLGGIQAERIQGKDGLR
ncbi:amino acid synthesis family protein [Ramlibacter henchirensis]|uniref:Amino acid synthesis family protein n=1 Tax=Ramlibacter henchirensis TaxID=204072 RepID=A0A4Z0C5J1_9BURK|nr:amino acid synthesis family protein [Ramlibacter henchirensis]TFZ05720.1 amino acid synthesis family protein [Ramlibacter henchirensis]